MIDPKIVSIIRHYYHARGHNNDYDKNNLGFGFIHYSLIRNLRPDRVLCVGSQRGYVPAICGLACKDEGKGHVDFVDLGLELGEKNSWGGIGIWKRATNDYWWRLGVEDWITIHNCSTAQFKPKEYDYISLDGDHSYEGIKRDKLLFWPHLNKGGIMAITNSDEDKMTRYGKCGVKKFWQDMERDYKQHINLKISSGLGLLQK